LNTLVTLTSCPPLAE